AFLVISVAVATFAATYRATLERGQREQAAFALGADIVLREDLRRLVPVREVATERRLAGLGDDVDAAPVIRQVANVAGVGTLSAITLLGLEPKLLETLRGSSFDAPDLAFPSELRGPRLPPSARELELGGRSSVAGLSLGVALRQPDGAYEQIELSVPGRAAIPRAARGGTLLGFQLLPPPRLREAGADAGRPLVAEIELEPLRAGGAVVSGYADWVGIGGASFARGRLGVTVTPGIETWFRPRQAIDTMSLPAVVSPLLARLADDSGRLTLQVGGRPVRLEVAGVATRFPSARNDFAVVDRAALDSAMNLAAPGSGFATEAWLDATTPAAETTVRSRLRRAPFDALVLDSRVEREARLRGDPLARGALAMLLVGAAISLLLALLALALAALSDLRDDRRELLDLETQGAAPRLLRRLIRLRQLGAGTLGLVGGLLTGAVLAALVVDVVAVSATGERPVPPLELSLDPIAVVAVVGGVGLIGALVIVATTRGAFRARAAGRPAREDP
nr:hypothetical protein [Actinomycetota bacterium]